MTVGPVEYLVVGFPDGFANDDIAPALAELVDNKVLRILDVVFLSKDATGDVSIVEVDELDDAVAFAEIDGKFGGLIGPEDIGFVGEELEAPSSAVILLVEDLWATPLAEAIDRAGGFLVGGARIPDDIVETAFGDLASLN